MTLREAQLCKKTIFRALFFFPHYSLKLKEARLCKKNISGSKKMFFFHTALVKLREALLCKKKSDSISFCTLTLWNSDKPGLGFAKKTTFQALKTCFSTLLLWNLEKLGFVKKNRLYFFCTLTLWNSDKPGFAKSNFSGSKQSFFRMPLVKSAKSTSLPRF